MLWKFILVINNMTVMEIQNHHGNFTILVKINHWDDNSSLWNFIKCIAVVKICHIYHCDENSPIWRKTVCKNGWEKIDSTVNMTVPLRTRNSIPRMQKIFVLRLWQHPKNEKQMFVTMVSTTVFFFSFMLQETNCYCAMGPTA